VSRWLAAGEDPDRSLAAAQPRDGFRGRSRTLVRAGAAGRDRHGQRDLGEAPPLPEGVGGRGAPRNRDRSPLRVRGQAPGSNPAVTPGPRSPVVTVTPVALAGRRQGVRAVVPDARDGVPSGGQVPPAVRRVAGLTFDSVQEPSRSGPSRDRQLMLVWDPVGSGGGPGSCRPRGGETVSSYLRRRPTSHLDRRAPSGPDQCHAPGGHRAARPPRSPRQTRTLTSLRRRGVARPRRGDRRAAARLPAGPPQRRLAAAGRHRSARPLPGRGVRPAVCARPGRRHPDGPAGARPANATCG
jgi:hypothetical protein